MANSVSTAGQFSINPENRFCWMNHDLRPRRIVSLQPSATVILRDLGQLDRVVACTKYCVDVCPEAASGRRIVDDSWTAHAEEIAALKPDLVIAAVPYQEKSVAEILKAGARFLGLAPHKLDDIYMDIAAIAALVGAGERGDRVVISMQGEIEKVRARVANLPRPTVFCEEWGKPIIASQTWVAELIEAAGGKPISEAGHKPSAEEVKNEGPDVLIAAWCGAGDRVPLEKIVRERGWSEMRAVKEGRVYCIRDEFLNTPAPTLIAGLHALAAAIHPKLFKHSEGLRRISHVSAESHIDRRTVV
jgi:iron complex transport system substrate-binding protein